MTTEDISCGCGREGKYIHTLKDGTVTYACNKYSRCKTYEQLLEIEKVQKSLIAAYRNKRKYDGMNGRQYNAAEHFKAESDIEICEQTLSKTIS